MNTPELSLPAGSLQCALYAFKGGADSVYFGLKSFSARKGAVNFSFDDLRKIARFCKENGKKYYITINTLLDDEQIPELMGLLKQVEYTTCDGVIVQDLGVARIIRERFPSLSLHASTQLAVHTVEGVRILQEIGFKRIVLARELSFKEISDIRNSCPDIELKVFIHGAMCYGFSGLCMASEVLTGRSANRGSCAQICRTWFSAEKSPETAEIGKFYPFSMKDLCLGEKIAKLIEIGIDSFKIEGRMKSAEYVYSSALYYRSLIDRVCGKAVFSDKTLANLSDNMRTTFSRETTTAFFDAASGCMNTEAMTSPDWPGNRGIIIGTVKRSFHGKATLLFEKPVSLRDGLFVISGTESAGFALTEISSGRSFIGEGETATINFPTDKFAKSVPSGTPVYCTGRHNAALPLLSENLPLFKKPQDFGIELFPGRIVVNGESYPVAIEEAKTQTLIEPTLEKVFSSSDKSYFTLGHLSVSNKSGHPQPFIPLSSLKEIRRSVYKKLDAAFEAEMNGAETPEAREKSTENREIASYEKNFSEATERKDPSAGGMEALHYLHPLMLSEQSVKPDAEFERHQDIVLNNIAHITYARQYPEKRYYLGPFLYAKNRYAYAELESLVPNLCGFASPDESGIPIFISRVCYRHNALRLPCKGCSRDNSYRLRQNGKTFIVKCRACITEVYLSSDR